MPTQKVLNQIITKHNGIRETYTIGDIIEGYYDSLNDKFYKEDTFETEIEGASGFLYIDLSENTLYIYDVSTSSFVQVSGSGGGLEYVDTLPSPPDIKDAIYGYYSTVSYTETVATDFLDDNQYFDKTGDNYAPKSGVDLTISSDDTTYKTLVSLVLNGTDYDATYDDTTTHTFADGDTFYYKVGSMKFYAGDETNQVLYVLAGSNDDTKTITYVTTLPVAPNIEDNIYGIDASTTTIVTTIANVADLQKVDGLAYNTLTTTFTIKDRYTFTDTNNNKVVSSIVYDDSGIDPVYTVNYADSTSTDFAEDNPLSFSVVEIITDYYVGNAETQLLEAIDHDTIYKYLTAADIDELMNSVAGRQWDYLADVITDNVTSTQKVWSSSKVSDELDNTLDASKTYTDQQISRFRSTSYVLVSSTAEMDNPSVLYLLPISGEDAYEIYALIKNTSDVYVPTAIGTTQAKLEDYYTKTEADALFVRSTDVITKTKYGNEIGDVTDLETTSQEVVGAINELNDIVHTFETVNIDWNS